jgi:CubicO group peptidase (beta-lactamase class C family)
VSGERGLPGQASLRYLKLQAKRRRAAGEFPTLHDAQRAIAREHGQRSWAALREAVAAAEAAARGEGHALTELRWIVSRFRDADAPGWTAPGDAELRAHFSDRFLAEIPPDRIVSTLTRMTAELRADLTVVQDTRFAAQGQLAGHFVMAITEPRPPYRLSGIRLSQLGERVSDPRAAAAATASSGAVPAGLPAMAEAAMAQLGLVGLSLSGGTLADGTLGEIWVTATGWADLEGPEPLTPAHTFPANEITMVVTALAVLRLAAAGRLRLDDPAGRYLGAVQLADDTVTVRELLTHTGGVADPPAFRRQSGPALEHVAGPVLACTGRRGGFDYSIAGYAALGAVVAERAGEPYQDAAARLVLQPLGMRDSWFPAPSPADQAPGNRSPAGGRAVTGYGVAADGMFTPLPGTVGDLPATGWLWTTAADLVRLGLGWSSLLPRSLSAQALRPHVAQPNGAQHGLGWILNERTGLAGHSGAGPGTAASLLVSLDGRHACAAMANRQILLDAVAGRALALTRGGPGGAETGGPTGETRTRSE